MGFTGGLEEGVSDHISHIEHLIYQQQYIDLSIVCLFTTCLYYACHSIVDAGRVEIFYPSSITN